MNINIANNLKRLRKQRELTQEDLASFIGVSFQAVSKWECGDGYPDITILPTIASFFNVTLDELVGMGEIKNQVKLDEVKEQNKKLSMAGKEKENIDLLRESLKTFPNDYDLLSKLAFFLSAYEPGDVEKRKKNNTEAVKISERILEFCTDTSIRNEVQANMCWNLYNSGENEKAVELSKKLPNIYKTREHMLPQFLNGKEKAEESQNAIRMLISEFYTQTRRLASETEQSLYTDEERIKLYQKIIDVYKIVFEKEIPDFGHVELNESYKLMAHCYMLTGKPDEAIFNLEKAAEHAIAYVTIPETQKYKSLLINTLTGGKGSSSTGTEKNVAYLLKYFIENFSFNPILTDVRIQKILNKLGEYSN